MEIEFAGHRHAVPDGGLVLGSDPGAGLVLAGARPRHAVVRSLGERMATIRSTDREAEVLVNGVACGPEPTPLMHGDVITILHHELKVLNPTHPAGGPNQPPPGARERLHDTLFGLPKTATPVTGTPAATRPPAPTPPPPPARGGRTGVILAALVSLALLAWLLLR